VKTVTESGWRSAKDGQLIPFAEKNFDLFVTVDRRMEFENRLDRFRLAFLIIRVRSNKLADFLPLYDSIQSAVDSIRPGQIIRLGDSHRSR